MTDSADDPLYAGYTWIAWIVLGSGGKTKLRIDHNTIAFVVVLVVGLTSLASGVGKLRDRGGFVRGIRVLNSQQLLALLRHGM